MSNNLQDLQDFYLKNKEHLNISFDDYVKDMYGSIKWAIKRDAFTNLLLKKLKEKYPEYIITNTGVDDDPNSIGIAIYNVPEDLYFRGLKNDCKSLEDECYDLMYDLCQGEMDVLFFIINETTTKEHYGHILEQYKK